MEKLGIYFLSISGIFIVFDAVLKQFLDIAVIQDSFVLGYCILFVIVSMKYPSITEKKFVIIPIYLMIIQMIYSLTLKYFYNS